MKPEEYEFYLDLQGDHTQLGLAHGEALRPVIQDAIGRWKNELAEAAGIPFADLLDRFNKTVDYRPAIARWAPDLLEEVRAVGTGADVDFEIIYAWQLVDEIIDFLVENIYAEKCSTVGGYDQGLGLPPVLGKTQDLPHCYIGAHALIRTRYAGSNVDILNSTVAGIICQDGMSRTLGLALNHVGQLSRDSKGLPVAYICRQLLAQCHSIEEASRALSAYPHASGMNYALIDRDSVRSFEASADHLAEYCPAPELKRIWHTNHPMANEHYCRDISLWNRLDDGEAGNTAARMEFLAREASKPDQQLTTKRVGELLSSREVPISNHAEDDFPTINSMIMEIGERPRLLFSPGPPSQCDYLEFNFDAEISGL